MKKQLIIIFIFFIFRNEPSLDQQDRVANELTVLAFLSASLRLVSQAVHAGHTTSQRLLCLKSFKYVNLIK